MRALPRSEIMNAEWRPSSHSDPEWYWEQTITWVVLCMLLKDLPWLLATVNKVKNANLVFAHHIGCIVGGLLCLHYNAKGARMMAPGFTIVQELGSACYTYISVYPDHRGVCLGSYTTRNCLSPSCTKTSNLRASLFSYNNICTFFGLAAFLISLFFFGGVRVRVCVRLVLFILKKISFC